MNTKALIFDFDGVLVDLEPLHMKAWQFVLAPLNLNFSDKEYEEYYLGLNDRDIVMRRFQHAKRSLTQTEAEELICEKEEKTHAIFAKEIPLVEGAEDFVKKVFKKYPLSIVTGALKSEVHLVLKRLGWQDYFPIVISANDVKRGKPDPEGFLKAYEELKKIKEWNPELKKEECLIFEDSQYGIQAAKNAGIPCLHVKGSLLPFIDILL
ncbi:MAG: HAD family phosphatase [Deltaproteobacteria bacterium]|nr:HAD family phosphatase [Deltaproteobacteria bacterium]